MLNFGTRKKTIFSILIAALFSATGIAINWISYANNSFAIEYNYPIPSGYTTITDQNFYECVAKEFNKEFPNETIPSDGLTNEQLGRMTKLDCYNHDYKKPDEDKIADVTGLEKMVELTYLDLSYNKISSINISNNTKLTTFGISSQYYGTEGNNRIYTLSSIDVSNNISLEVLYIGGNGLLDSIDVTQNTNLIDLDISSTQILNIDVTKNLDLAKLDVGSNGMSNLDISKNTNLEKLDASNNRLGELDLSKNIKLVELDVSENQISSLGVSNNTKLEALDASDNQLNGIDITKNVELWRIDLGNHYSGGKNIVNSLDISNNKLLTNLDLSNVQLKNIDLTNNELLSVVQLNNNLLDYIDVSKNSELNLLEITNNNITSLDISSNANLMYLQIQNNIIDSLYIPSGIIDKLHFLSDDILVKASFAPKSIEPLIYDLSDIQFLNFSMQTIDATDYYTFDDDNKLLTMNKPSSVENPIRVVSDIDYWTYNLVFIDEEESGNEIIIPDTSSADAPDTGINTNSSKGSNVVILLILPIIIAIVLGGAFAWKRNRAHRKFEW